MDIIDASVKYKPKYRYVIPSIITYLEIPLKDSINELGKPYPSIHPSTNSTLLRNWQEIAYIPSESHYPLVSGPVIATLSRSPERSKGATKGKQSHPKRRSENAVGNAYMRSLLVPATSFNKSGKKPK